VLDSHNGDFNKAKIQLSELKLVKKQDAIQELMQLIGYTLTVNSEQKRIDGARTRIETHTLTEQISTAERLLLEME
jgi:hypothetical protein